MSRPRLALPTALVALTLLAVGCGASDGSSTGSAAPAGDAQAKATSTCLGGDPIAAGQRIRIASTVAPITSIVANVAGGLADITGLVPEGTNSHTFEPP